mgnify:CR=1 FL=1
MDDVAAAVVAADVAVVAADVAAVAAVVKGPVYDV